MAGRTMKSPMKINAARGYGATIDTEAADIPSAFERLEELMAELGGEHVRTE